MRHARPILSLIAALATLNGCKDEVVELGGDETAREDRLPADMNVDPLIWGVRDAYPAARALQACHVLTQEDLRLLDVARSGTPLESLADLFQIELPDTIDEFERRRRMETLHQRFQSRMKTLDAGSLCIELELPLAAYDFERGAFPLHRAASSLLSCDERCRATLSSNPHISEVRRQLAHLAIAGLPATLSIEPARAEQLRPHLLPAKALTFSRPEAPPQAPVAEERPEIEPFDLTQIEKLFRRSQDAQIDAHLLAVKPRDDSAQLDLSGEGDEGDSMDMYTDEYDAMLDRERGALITLHASIRVNARLLVTLTEVTHTADFSLPVFHFRARAAVFSDARHEVIALLPDAPERDTVRRVEVPSLTTHEAQLVAACQGSPREKTRTIMRDDELVDVRQILCSRCPNSLKSNKDLALTSITTGRLLDPWSEATLVQGTGCAATFGEPRSLGMVLAHDLEGRLTLQAVHPDLAGPCVPLPAPGERDLLLCQAPEAGRAGVHTLALVELGDTGSPRRDAPLARIGAQMIACGGERHVATLEEARREGEALVIALGSEGDTACSQTLRFLPTAGSARQFSPDAEGATWLETHQR